MDRRTFLLVSGGSGLAFIAGCTGNEETDYRSVYDTNDNAGFRNEYGATVNQGEYGDDEEGDDESPGADAETLVTVGSIESLDEVPFDVDVIDEFEDSGHSVTDTFSLEQGMTMLVFEEESGEGMAADIEQEDGDDGEIWVINEVMFTEDQEHFDRLTGANLVDVEGGEYILDVEAEEEWAINVVQPRSPDEEIRIPPVSADGEETMVAGPVEIDDGATIRFEHHDEEFESFIDVMVYVEDESGFDAMDFAFTAEESGFEGETRVDVDGVSWVSVRAKGEWSLEVGE